MITRKEGRLRGGNEGGDGKYDHVMECERTLLRVAAANGEDKIEGPLSKGEMAKCFWIGFTGSSAQRGVCGTSLIYSHGNGELEYMTSVGLYDQHVCLKAKAGLS